jgi:hypothetical protein
MLGKRDEQPGVPLGALALRAEMAGGKMARLKEWPAGDASVTVLKGYDAVWVTLRRQDGAGFALRAALSPGGVFEVSDFEEVDEVKAWEFRVSGSLGEYRVCLRIPDPNQSLFRCTVGLTPSANLLTTFWTRDLYPIDENGDPLETEGRVHAGQRGLNGGLVYLTLAKPRCGSLLYFQNLTALNDYCLATGTKPDGVVGGQWPELGCQLPTTVDARNPPEKALPAGREFVLSDVFLHFRAEIPEDTRQSARQFLDLLGGVYAHLERPDTEYHDWPRRAEETLRDLANSPKATIRHYGNLYVHPYTDAEYPDSMVQLTVTTPILEYQEWKGKPIPLADELRKGMRRFYDKELKVVRRYLPNVGDDKNADEVDSWYLYHPLTNLARLALEYDDRTAREMFLGSLDYAIKAAHHFQYNWPVMYNVRTMEVIEATRKEHEPGQSDAGGLYAYVMLKAWEMTGEGRYLEEARKAIDATKDREFDLAYQTNLTAWGVNACIHLWRITGEEFYREQSYVFLASFFHNTVIWESRLGTAEHYSTFLGETCLHDAPYMAIYECFESYCAFHEYLTQGQEDLPDSVRLLVTEYLKYTLTRAWYYYPKELPEDVLSKEVRNAHIDRKLAFPLEDLYPDGQPAGQVGQEIYGCGAAFSLVKRSYHRPRNAPFLVYCEYPLSDVQDREEQRVMLEIRGVMGTRCRVRLIPDSRAGGRNTALPPVTIHAQGHEASPDEEVEGQLTPEGHCEYFVPAGRRLTISWSDD